MVEIDSNRRPSEPISGKLFDWMLIGIEFVSLLVQVTWLSAVALFRCLVPEAKKSVRGRVALITGAGHGLGRLLALNFAKLGARVVLWDIDKERCESVAKEIRELKGQAWAYQCDVSDEKQVEETGEAVRRDVGDVRILINNAGVLPGKPIMYLNSYQIRRTLEINTLAHFWTIRQFLPTMLEISDGHIVAVASVAGILGCANLTDYCASKYAVVGLMQALREDLHVQGKEDNIHLTICCPSTMNTDLVQRPKTRFPSLFPVLNVEDVANTITDAVLRNKRMVILPSIASAIFRFAQMLPPNGQTVLQRFIDYTIEPNMR